MALLTPPTPDVLPVRKSISFGLPSSGALLRPGDATYNETLSQHFPTPEARALEMAIDLKSRVRRAPLEDFWGIVSKGLADICGAQIAFISQRLASDDADSDAAAAATAAAAAGHDEDSYLCALAWYFQDRNGHRHSRRNTRYFGWGCPCAAMKYGQVFLIPSRLQEHAPDNPNSVFRTLGADAYIGLPLYYNGRCNAHFGLSWTAEGVRACKLSWPFIESVLHSFEDLILQRILEGATVQAHAEPDTASQSGHEVTGPGRAFVPPVHILSHELRTPMQGVIGMLDLMHDIVEDAVEGQQNSRARDVFRSLKLDIETIQESSKRAVDAADHVVQAYEREIMHPNRSVSTREPSPAPSDSLPSPRHGCFPLSLVEGSPRGTKRRASLPPPTPEQRPAKLARFEPRSENGPVSSPKPVLEPRVTELADVRQLIAKAIGESFRVSGLPQAVDARTVHNGSHFEARYNNPDGSSNVKHVDLLVDNSVPKKIHVACEDFIRVISALLRNAIKFTTDANITLFARLENAGHMLSINVRDNGPGIDVEFQTLLFRPFSKAETSIRRRTEGLGLGLAVAKSIAEAMGGVLNLASAATEGPGRGCDFEFRLPLSPLDYAADADVRRHSTSSTGSSRRPSLSAPLPVPPLTAPAKARSTIHARRKLAAPKSQGKLAGDYPLTFLVVEDNHINRKLLVNMLIKLGYNPSTQIHEAYDGAKAVKMATTLHETSSSATPDSRPAPLDIILMDLWMPRMDGYEATERILTLFGQDDTTPTPTVWAVTADATTHALEQANKAGMKGFMKKPFQLKDLEHLIKDTWEKRKRWEMEKNADVEMTATALPSVEVPDATPAAPAASSKAAADEGAAPDTAPAPTEATPLNTALTTAPS